MKKILSIIFILSIAMFSYAQKGSVSKAKSYRNKADYINAKAEIDMAITIEKTAKKSATWFERGELYRAIALSDDEAVFNVDTEALVKSNEAYKKVLSMEKEGSVNAVFSTQYIDALWGHYLNKGGEQYGAKDFKGCYESFVNALKIRPDDSLTLFYAGVTAQQADDFKSTSLHYNKLVELNKASNEVFTTLIYIERAINKDPEKALEVIYKAKEKFPSDTKLSQEEIAILISLDKLDEAKNRILSEIENDPTNVNLYLNLAIMHDNLGTADAEAGRDEEAKANFQTAKESYEKVVELDVENYVGNFNLGAIYVNSAKVYYDIVRDMDLDTYDKKGPALEDKADAILKESLPFMKKASSIKPDDIDALKAIQQIYTQLKMFDEAEAMMNKVDALSAAQEEGN